MFRQPEPYQILKPGVDKLYHNEEVDTTQNVFGIPGASLQHAPLPDAAKNAGIAGEQLVATELNSYITHNPQNYVFHSVKLPNHTGDIDHIIINRNTIVLIDTKNWKKEAHYLLHPGDNHDTVTRDGETFSGGDIHLTQHQKEWAAAYPNHTVHAILVVANEISFAQHASASSYHFVNLLGLTNTLNRLLTSATPPTLVDVQHFASLTHNPDFNPEDPENYMWVNLPPEPKKPTRPQTWWFAAWSTINYILLPFTLPLAALSAFILIIFTHHNLTKTRKENAKGTLVSILTLTFSYLLLFGWLTVLLLIFILNALQI